MVPLRATSRMGRLDAGCRARHTSYVVACRHPLHAVPADAPGVAGY